MTWPKAPSVLLVSDDARCLELLAAELRAMGCRVLCARDLERAAALVRAGLPTAFVLVYLGEDLLSPADVRVAMAAGLPEWDVQGDETGHKVIAVAAAAERLLN